MDHPGTRSSMGSIHPQPRASGRTKHHRHQSTSTHRATWPARNPTARVPYALPGGGWGVGGDLEAEAAALLLLATFAQLTSTVGGVVAVSSMAVQIIKILYIKILRSAARRSAARSSVAHRTLAASLNPIPGFLVMPRACERSSAISTAVWGSGVVEWWVGWWGGHASQPRVGESNEVEGSTRAGSRTPLCPDGDRAIDLCVCVCLFACSFVRSFVRHPPAPS